jgi:hypothetical protein
MQESTLHAMLKEWYTEEGDRQESWVDGYLVDVLHDDLLIEIQTRGFTALKPKLTTLLEKHRVRLVHPIAQEKWIIYLPILEDQPLSRRKSPRRGRLEHIFLELIRIPHLVTHPNFSLEILLTREEEIRRRDGQGSWRRRGVSIIDRRLIEVVNRQLITSPEDFRAFLPDNLQDPFTNDQLAKLLVIPLTLAQKMTYCLRRIGILSVPGKRSNTYLYTINPRAESPPKHLGFQDYTTT